MERRLNLPRTTTIHNPVPSISSIGTKGDPANTDLIAFAGRFVAEKGLDLLLHALVKLPGIRLEVAGDGPLAKDWRELARRVGIADRVKFLGAQSLEGVTTLYRSAAVVCMPSLWQEPFGYAAAEAMALGRAVVATPSGALPELLADGRGFVAAAPTPGALAATLKAVLTDGDRRRSAEVKARDFALNKLSLESIGPKYEALYEAAAS